MTIALCAGGEDREVIRGTLLDWAERGDRGLSLEVYGCREALLRGMKNIRFDAVFLAMPGVEGMEAAIGVRGQSPGVPLVWVSDDKLLAILSYRLRVRLFLLSPVEPEQVLEGLERCGLEEPEAARYPSPRKAPFAGTVAECCKGKFPGAAGHIAIGCRSVERAAAYLEQKGVRLREEFRNVAPDGQWLAAYLEEEFGGFAVHLLKKP